MVELIKDNHFVPKVYLKNWQSSPNKAYVYRTLVSHEDVPLWSEKSIENIASYDHLYTEVTEKNEIDEMERWFCDEFESPAESVICKVVNNQKMTPDDWRILIRFLALQDVRTPKRFLEHYERATNIYPELMEKSIDESFKKYEKMDRVEREEISTEHNNERRLPIKVTVNKVAGVVNATASVGRNSWLYSIRTVLSSTINELHKHRWTIYRPYKGLSWFTSDNPVIKLNFNDENNYDLRGGWGKENGNILMPLSPEHLLFTQIGQSRFPDHESIQSKNKTLLFRKIIAENSHRLIISDKRDDSVKDILKREVNPTLYESERTLKNNWHSSNSRIERSLL